MAYSAALRRSDFQDRLIRLNASSWADQEAAVLPDGDADAALRVVRRQGAAAKRA